MKKYYTLPFLAMFLFLQAYSQSTVTATWMSGDNVVNQPGVYGTKGVPSSQNKPGGREGAVGWRDAAGNLWFFGGEGYAGSFTAALNDLWKYDPSVDQWTWMSGDNTARAGSVYGTKGLASPANQPSARYNAVSWTDAAGNFWLFGGYGYGSGESSSGYLNDLWKYTTGTNQWLWIGGDSIVNQGAHYGSKGVASPTNFPGARYNAVSWTDAAGNFWLFGGYGYSGTTSGSLNDLWKYDPVRNEWTWMSGDNVTSQLSVYGTKGVASPQNKPGGRTVSASWTDLAGNIWLFGGYGYASGTNPGHLNDLWKYDPSAGQWTWMNGDNATFQTSVYGTKGVASSATKPGPRYEAVSWTDAAGYFWMFGGDDDGGLGTTNDLWKYTPATNQWAWMRGDETAVKPGVYGTKGVSSPFTIPGGRYGAIGWADGNNNLWLFGGKFLVGTTANAYNDLWKFTIQGSQINIVFRDVDGDGFGSSKDAIFTNSSIPQPGYVGDSTDCDDTQKLYADKDSDGHGAGMAVACGVASNDDCDDNNIAVVQCPSAFLNTAATWMSGDSTLNQEGFYGTRGISSPANKPRARRKAAKWTDTIGNLWLFGGYGFTQKYGNGLFNDLWKYDPSVNDWTWVSGDTLSGQASVYGTKGLAAPANKPGARQAAVSWTDASGNLWLYGGTAIEDALYYFRDLGDLWRFSPVSGEWTWVSGDNIPNQRAVYGTKGVASPNNKPGARQKAVSWIDISGNLWLFGGMYETRPYSALNDLWKYDPFADMWTWMSGDSVKFQANVYGTKGLASPNNKPGARHEAVSWTDAAGNIWLYGGVGTDFRGHAGSLSDLWKYDLARNEWTWMSGDNTVDHPGVYGTEGLASPNNFPGARNGAVTWTDTVGNFWLFGGLGYTLDEYQHRTWGSLNDLWKYNPLTNEWTWVSGDNRVYQSSVYGTKGISDPANKPGSRTYAVAWNDNSDNLWLFGGYGYATSTISGYLNDLWVFRLDAPTLTLTTSSLPVSSVCAGSEFRINYETQGSFGAGNTFTAQLSDASGSFANSINIGSVHGTTSGTIAVTVPANTPAGTGYRIRVVASSPVLTGTDNGTDLSINGQPTISVSSSSSSSGLSYRYYEGSWTQLPDFGGLTPVASGMVQNVTLSPRRRDDNFAFLFEGTITIAKAGSYYFETSSDDGSRLYIGGYGHFVTPVVNNDGQHADQLAGGWYTFPEAGTYPIAITYFEGGGAQTMRVYWTAPQAGIPNRTLIPDAAFGAQASSSPSLTYKYYEGMWTRLPDFGGLTPVATGTTDKVDIAPKKQSDSFAFLWEGQINIPKAGTYYFETASDDGSRLYIGNYGHYITPVVDNDGQHAMQFRGGWYTFPSAGTYPIAISFFEAGGSEGIEVYWSSADAGIPTRTLIPGSAFREGGTVSNDCTAGVTLMASEGESYLWSTGETIQSITVRQNGCYTVTVTKGGCSASSEPMLITCIDNSLTQKLREAKGSAAPAGLIASGQLTANALPNPSPSHFTLQLSRPRLQERITLRILDGVGRLVETKTLAAGTTLQIGHTYRPGTYFAVVIQGGEKQILKLVKTTD